MMIVTLNHKAPVLNLMMMKISKKIIVTVHLIWPFKKVEAISPAAKNNSFVSAEQCFEKERLLFLMKQLPTLI